MPFNVTPAGHRMTQRELGMRFGLWAADQPGIPSAETIRAEWGMTRATAYRWRAAYCAAIGVEVPPPPPPKPRTRVLLRPWAERPKKTPRSHRVPPRLPFRRGELGIEARCRKCGEWWPCDPEFFYFKANGDPQPRCKACYCAKPRPPKTTATDHQEKTP